MEGIADGCSVSPCEGLGSTLEDYNGLACTVLAHESTRDACFSRMSKK